MSACQTLIDNASFGVAPALRAVDCLAGETTAAAFGRLFGAGGALLPALTIILTLYIAFFAFSLITGRSRLGISALTPRMLTLGMVLTFATSWAAYQGVVWNLAIGAPDQIAGALMGSSGSATQLFADRMDIVFAAIAEAATSQQGATAQAVAEGAQQAAQSAPAAAAAGNFTPTNLTWLAALILLLGTVGVLVTARIALAVLLALGPIFIVLGLFSGTRGLCAGWLRGVVLTAVTPLFVVIGGGIVMELLIPVVAMLRDVEGISGRAALALFLIAAVHAALMIMIMRVAGTMVSGWQVFGLASGSKSATGTEQASFAPAMSAPLSMTAAPAAVAASRRSAVLVQAGSAGEAGGAAAASTAGQSRGGRTVVNHVSGTEPALPALARQRARGIGSRFRAPQPRAREMMR